MPLDVTVGGANADSYASVAEADVCNASNLYASGWATAPTADKETALRMACKLLDGMPAAWTGQATNPSVQALGWPRQSMKNRNNYPIPSNVIPGNLKCAQAEYARLLLENDLTVSAANADASGVQSVSAGGVSVSLKSTSSSSSKVGDPRIGNIYAKPTELAAQVPSSVIILLVPSWLKDPRDIDAPYTGLFAEVL